MASTRFMSVPVPADLATPGSVGTPVPLNGSFVSTAQISGDATWRASGGTLTFEISDRISPSAGNAGWTSAGYYGTYSILGSVNDEVMIGAFGGGGRWIRTKVTAPGAGAPVAYLMLKSEFAPKLRPTFVDLQSYMPALPLVINTYGARLNMSGLTVVSAQVSGNAAWVGGAGKLIFQVSLLPDPPAGSDVGWTASWYSQFPVAVYEFNDRVVLPFPTMARWLRIKAFAGGAGTPVAILNAGRF